MSIYFFLLIVKLTNSENRHSFFLFTWYPEDTVSSASLSFFAALKAFQNTHKTSCGSRSKMQQNMRAGVSIKFEVGSQFEKSRWRYWQGAIRITLSLLQFRQKVADICDRSSRRYSSDVGAYWNPCERYGMRGISIILFNWGLTTTTLTCEHYSDQPSKAVHPIPHPLKVILHYSDLTEKTVSFEEQMMSTRTNIQAYQYFIVIIILQIFFATCAVLKIGEYLTIVHQSGGKYPSLSPTPRWIIVLVYTTQAE